MKLIDKLLLESNDVDEDFEDYGKNLWRKIHTHVGDFIFDKVVAGGGKYTEFDASLVLVSKYKDIEIFDPELLQSTLKANDAFILNLRSVDGGKIEMRVGFTI